MKKNIINILLGLSILHLLIMLYYSFTSAHAYVVANFPQPLDVIMLIYSPIILTVSSVSIFVFDLIINKEKKWFLFFIAFIVNLSETIFVIGSLLFGGH
jgi:membrane-associated HD superfamily phosphohydrolase